MGLIPGMEFLLFKAIVYWSSKAIKSDFDTSHIPVILLTAKNSLPSKIEGL
jgi:hypothetical protein